MLCTACGESNPESARFCGRCAAPLGRTVACPACGAANPTDHRFCNACGGALGVVQPAAARLEMPAGERKQVTVLFADVVGSMDLAGGMDPDEWGELMERFFAVLRDGVNRFDGRIDKFTGDGVMALFGAPVAYEDHARRACGAALHLLDEVNRFAAELRRERGADFRIRMGLNSGEVVARSVGQDLKVEYTAVGNTVGLAQRMESLAEPGSVYLTAATAALAGGYYQIQDLGPMTVKGATGVVPVFELMGTGSARTPLEVAAARGFTRFVGRDREMAALEGAFADACNGNGQVVGVVAEPGLGKSRLCHEFVERCRARGVDVFVGHALAHARTVPFLTALEVVRTLFGIADQDDPATARAKIAGSVLDLDRSVGDALPLLWDFLGVPDAERAAPAADAEARQRQIFEALNRLRRARSQRAPFVMLVEDLHWLDPGSETFLENLVGTIQGLRVLVVTTFRPEYHPGWTHRAHYGQLPLLPLGDDARHELLRDLLGFHPSLDGVADLVRDRTGGNPFFMEEVVHGLVEDGSLHGERGAYELASTIDEVRVPATVQAVLGARIDRLREREKSLLQRAAVVGRQFSRRVVGRISGLADTELDDALRLLVEAELVYETAVFPEVEYTFKHGLTEEVAYTSQLARSRAAVHTAVAQALAELDPEKHDERASLVAHHFDLGGELLEAARWNARAATWAGYNNPIEAVRHWRRVRLLTAALGTSPDTAELAINARVQLLLLIWRLGAASEEQEIPFEQEAAAIYEELGAVADATDQPAIRVFALFGYGAVLQLSDAVVDGIDLALEALRLADDIGDRALRTLARTGSWGLFVLGRIPEATALAEEMVTIIGDDRSLARGLLVGSPYAWCRMQVAHFGSYLRRLDEGLIALERAIELLGEEGDYEGRSWAQRHYAVFADLAGADPDLAGRHGRAAVEWADEAGNAWARGFNRAGLATNFAHRGEWPDAIRTVDEALAIIRPRRIALADVPPLLSIRARAQVGLGDAAGARVTAAEAVAVAVRCGTQFYEAQARHQLARAILAAPAPGEEALARAELDHALSILTSHGIRAYAPYIHLERARLAEVVGDETTRETELRRAHQLFLDVGAHGRAEEVASMVCSG